MKKILLLLAVVLVTGAALSMPPHSSAAATAGTPSCVPCSSGGVFICQANYGVDCIPVIVNGNLLPHCTPEQAAAYCPGWKQLFANQ